MSNITPYKKLGKKLLPGASMVEATKGMYELLQDFYGVNQEEEVSVDNLLKSMRREDSTLPPLDTMSKQIEYSIQALKNNQRIQDWANNEIDNPEASKSSRVEAMKSLKFLEENNETHKSNISKHMGVLKQVKEHIGRRRN